jgi:hypothetical protein
MYHARLSGRFMTTLLHRNICDNIRALMQTNLLRIAALICFCVFAAPFSSFAQFNSDPAAYSQSLATIPSGNAAQASLQHAVACATMAAFSPVSSNGRERAGIFGAHGILSRSGAGTSPGSDKASHRKTGSPFTSRPISSESDPG